MNKLTLERTGIVVSVFFAIIVLDQLTKWAAIQLFTENLPEAKLGFSLQFNSGVLGGFMSSVPSWIRQIFFSVLGVFFSIFAWISFYFLKDKDVPMLKVGSILFGSSLLSNVWDRATRGHVVDFISIKLSEGDWFIINFADIVLFIGFSLIAISLIFEPKKIWRELESRKKVWIDRPFQSHYVTVLLVTGAINAAMIGIYAFAFLGVYLDFHNGKNIHRSEILADFGIGLVTLELCYLLLVAWLGIYFSHRVVGPIHAFEVFVDKLLSNEKNGSQTQILKLRKSDHFKSLEEIATRLLKQFTRQ